jgi:hypothetical protein
LLLFDDRKENTMRLSKRFGFLIAALLALGIAKTAHAGSGYGYACDVIFQNSPTSFIQYYNNGGTGGRDGYLYVSFYTGPSCSGNWLTGAFVCSGGATNSGCSQQYILSDSQLQSLYGNIQRAAAANQKVYVGLDSTAALYEISFWAAGY